ncbi:MAG: peptidoglycan endopeptidase, partial [Candidatus Saccharibacteria bacterium]|nr:peptidoglycan endopeptidase [Rhodoferax sp.]
MYAAPEVTPTDNANSHPERGLLTRFGEVTEQVEAKASELVGNALG